MDQECRKIVIIEDDEVIRVSFRMFLEHEGYGVESFENGKDALAYLTHEPEPCLILLDLIMPNMNGEEFMEAFKKLPATIVSIPVYLCSASACAEDSKRMGCDGFIKKPLDLNVLRMLVQSFCKKNSNAA